MCVSPLTLTSLDPRSPPSRRIRSRVHVLQHQEMDLNPLAPQVEPFDWALSWAGLAPTGQLAALLETSFFPGWLALLRHWLSGCPNYDEVTAWYLAWKGRLPSELADHPRVRACLAAALDMMNAAADGRPLPDGVAAAATATPASAPRAPSWRTELGAGGAGGAGGAAATPQGATTAPGAAALSLKDLVSRYAQEQGVEFLPRAGRLHDGLPVYSFGGVPCVLDGVAGLVRAQLRDRGWAPVSLEELRNAAAARTHG